MKSLLHFKHLKYKAFKTKILIYSMTYVITIVKTVIKTENLLIKAAIVLYIYTII